MPTSYDFLVSGNSDNWRVYNDPTTLETDGDGVLTCTVDGDSDGILYYAPSVSANTAYRLSGHVELIDNNDSEAFQIYLGQFTDISILDSNKDSGISDPEWESTGDFYVNFLLSDDADGNIYFRSDNHVDGFTFKLSNLSLKPLKAPVLTCGDFEFSLGAGSLIVTDGINVATVTHGGFSADDEIWAFCEADADASTLKMALVDDTTVTWDSSSAAYTGSMNPGTDIEVNGNEEYLVLGSVAIFEGVAGSDGEILLAKSRIENTAMPCAFNLESILLETINPA